MFLLASSAGCSTIKTEFGSPVDFEHIEALVDGVSTRRQVLAEFGPPMAISPYGDGVAFLYEHMQISEQQFGISLKNIPYVADWLGSLFKAVVGQGNTRHDAALLLFDEAGILEDAHAGSWPEILGRGGSLQFFTAVEPVVDSNNYQRPPLLMSWGLFMLDPLQQSQNQAQRALIDLRGTPVANGQRSLELLDWRTGE